MTLSEAIVTSRLDRACKYYDSIGSTNDAAKAWLVAGAPEGAVLVANEQTRGRGRKRRAWQSPPDAALALSVILKPRTCLVPRVNFLGALAICDLVAELGCTEFGIKWPNDVQISGKKIAGILPEVVWQGSEALGVVLGMGINARVDFSGTALADSAISLESVVNRRLDRADLLVSLLRHVDYWHSQIEEASLYTSWKQRLNMLGKRIKVDSVIGTAIDARPDGSLLLRADTGALHTASAGDVFLVNDPGADA